MELVETIFFLSKNDHRFLRVSNLKFFERMALTILRVKQNMKINPINTPSPPPPPHNACPYHHFNFFSK
jgi:hypothetical protein